MSRVCKWRLANSGKRSATPTHIVVHYTGVAEATPEGVLRSWEKRGAQSSHYIIDLNGRVVPALPEYIIAWHVGDGQPVEEYWGAAHAEEWHKTPPAASFTGNRCSIGVDVCCMKRDKTSRHATDADWWCTDSTIRSLISLLADICRRNHIPSSRILRHFDATGKLCPRPFVSYKGEDGPQSGDALWQRIIAAVAKELGE